MKTIFKKPIGKRMIKTRGTTCRYTGICKIQKSICKKQEFDEKYLIT